MYRLSDRRPLTLETGNSAAPRTCIETEEIVYGTLTDADILLLRLTETYDADRSSYRREAFPHLG